MFTSTNVYFFMKYSWSVTSLKIFIIRNLFIFVRFSSVFPIHLFTLSLSLSHKLHTHTYTHTRARAYAHTHTRVCKCFCMHAWVCVCVCIDTYIHTYRQTGTRQASTYTQSLIHVREQIPLTLSLFFSPSLCHHLSVKFLLVD